MVATTTVSVRRLIRELQSLPARPTVAVRVVMAANDPNSSAETLGRLIEIDPALTTQVMRLANSAYYGLTQRVASASRAVAVIGLGTVRALAAGTAAGVMGGGAEATPPGYWEHSVATAVAASLVAPKVGANASEAFSLGLLHDLGRALLYRCDPEASRIVVARVEAGDAGLLEAEAEVFGISHDDVAADVLAEWNFPDEFVDAIAQHHETEPLAPAPLLRALTAGEDAVLQLETGDLASVEAADWAAGHGFALAGLAPETVLHLADAVREGTASLVNSLLG